VVALGLIAVEESFAVALVLVDLFLLGALDDAVRVPYGDGDECCEPKN
jgi:hypothetical protein